MIPRPRFPRVNRSTLILVLGVAALAFPLGVLANHQFPDVPAAASYHDDVEALVEAGITTGCGGGNYCPAAAVTRGSMAQFLNRLGSLDGTTTPSVNANTARSTDGWSIGCPSSTVLSGGLCFETSARTAQSIFGASETCANLGGGLLGRGQIWTLPAALELRAAHANGDITISAEEWSSSFAVDGASTGFEAVTVNGTTLDDEASPGSQAFRCAAIPLQIDNFIFIPLDEEQDGTDAGPDAGTDGGSVNADGSTN